MAKYKWTCRHPDDSIAYFLDVPGQDRIYRWEKNSARFKLMEEDDLQAVGKVCFTCAQCKEDYETKDVATIRSFLASQPIDF